MKTFLSKRKINNIIEFYKSTIALNFSVSVFGFIFGGFNTFFVMILSFGFFMSLIFKEVYRKSDYLFYFSNGISKTRLIGFSFILNTIFSGFLIAIINLIFQ